MAEEAMAENESEACDQMKATPGDGITTESSEEHIRVDQDAGSKSDEADASTASSSSGGLSSEANTTNGEILQLLKSAEEDSLPLTAHVKAALTHQLSKSSSFLELDALSEHEDTATPSSWYGHRLTQEEANVMVPPVALNDGNEGGLVWYATIIPDAFFANGKLKRGLNKRDFDLDANKIKPRRPSLLVTASDFFSSLTKVEGHVPKQSHLPSDQAASANEPTTTSAIASNACAARYVFHGVLNGWPSLRAMELVAIEQRRDHKSIVPTPKEFLSGQILWWRTWGAETDGQRGSDPKILQSDRIYRAKLCAAQWTSVGWSPTSPGYCFWHEPQRQRPFVSYGTDLLTTVDPNPICTHVHMIAHRYASARETPRDLLTYHTVCLLEWDHGQYCTVVELAFLNGLGGYKGKSNWYDDRDAKVTALYEAFPPEMLCPWKETRGEIRCLDVPSRNLREFLAYVDKYKGSRFIDPRLAFSHVARLTFRSKAAIAQYLLNYVRRDSTYAELKRNCQTFSADFCAFLAGKRVVQPFHPVSRIEYMNR